MVSALLCELKTSFNPAVCVDPSTNQSPGTPASSTVKILIVGAGHARRLSEQLASMADISAITQGGWRTGRNGAVVPAIAITEQTAASGMFHLIVLQIFDNAAFYARTYEGGLIPCQRELVSGTYHTDGDVVVQPVEALEAVFNDFQSIFLRLWWHLSFHPVSAGSLHQCWLLR
jgi:hypothetical protein